MNNVEKLPSSYAREKTSNNYKLLNLNEQAVEQLKKDMNDVLNALDITQATGRTLELYGEMVGQKRGTLNDEQYRYMILTRMGMNVVQGNYDTVIESAMSIFNCKASDIILQDGKMPCRVEVVTFPLEVLVSAGFSSEQAVALLESLLPAGVTIETANFGGTFEFADTADEYDELAGFANIEQTIGGYFGLLQGEDENSPILPL